MSIITARLNNDTDIYSGPGESYESLDHILSEGVLNVYYSEGDWYYVSCSPDYLVFNTDTVYGYVHGSVLIDMTGTPEELGGSTGGEGGGDSPYEYVAMAITNNDSDIYDGPGENYESIDHIVAGETVGILSDEGNWCYVECPAGSLSFSTESLCGYIPTSVLEFISDGDTGGSTGITAHTVNDIDGYYGPSSNYYDFCEYLPGSQEVTVLWEEGDYYYIECYLDYANELRRMYVAKDYIEGLDGTPSSYTESYSSVELECNTMGYTGPGTNYEVSGEVTTDWAISKLDGIEENGFILIEHPGDGNRYKRVWVAASAVVIPDPDPVDPPVTPEPDEPDTPAVPDFVTTTLDDTDTYYGPDATAYDYCDHIPAGETITILWKEGDYYYVEATFMIYHEGSEETGDWYEEGTKRMYIHQDYVGDFTGTVPELIEPSYLEVNFTEAVNCYAGPGLDYEPDGMIWPDGPHTLLRRKSENGFALIDTVAYDNIGMRVWADTNKIILPDLVTYTIDETDGYYGPGSTSYDYCDHLPAGELVTILWKEGDWYYVYVEGDSFGNVNVKRRMYVHKDSVGIFTGEVPDKTNLQCTTVVIDSNVSVVSGPAMVYEPIEYLDADKVVTQLGVGEENSCVFIEYTANDGLKKRGWVPKTAVRDATSDEISVDNLIVATGTVRTVDADNNPVSVKFMWGPEGVRKTIYKEGNTIAGSTSVDILWQEGDFYYVRYKVKVGGIDKYRCIYLKTGDVNITNTSNTSLIPDREMDTSPNSYRYAKQDIDLYYYPVDGAEKAGSLSRLETMRKLGVTIGDYTLVEYDTGFTPFDEIYEDLTENSTSVEDEENTEWIKAGVYAVRKRAWINKNNVSEMPKPDGEVYLDTEGGIVRSEQKKNAEYIFKYLKALGFSDNAICAILGNIMKECTMNPAWLEETTRQRKGYGIMQWTHYSKYLNRAVGDGMITLPKMRRIDEYANKPNETLADGTVIDYKKNLMQSQLEGMLWCCTNTGDQWYDPENPAIDYVNHTGKDMTFAEFMTSSENVKVLAMVFHDYFLRSGDFDKNHEKGEFVYPTEIKTSLRADYAQGWYDYLCEEGLIIEE